MYRSYGFLKTLICKADLIPASQAVEGKINYLAFATGVWLEDTATLFTQPEFNQDWHDIGYRYLAKLYDIIDPDQSAMVIHQQLSDLHQINFSCNIKKWIRLLDTGPLKEANPDAAGNQKCIIDEHKDDRINLPPFYSQNYKVKDLLKKIEQEVAAPRGHKKAASSAAPNNSSTASKAPSADSLDANTIIPAIEKEINCQIEKVLFQFVDSTHIPKNTLFAPFRKLNKNIDKKLLNKLVVEARGGEPGPDGVLFGDLVRLYIASPGKFDKQR